MVRWRLPYVPYGSLKLEYKARWPCHRAFVCGIESIIGHCVLYEGTRVGKEPGAKFLSRVRRRRTADIAVESYQSPF